VRVGYETYGKLNAAGDNAVFIAHFFSGTSHAAGRYKPDEKAAGYWDAIIGSGKAIDTDKYFVVSADTLVNLNVKSAMVGTVGPATLNPDTGKPYGSSFPVVSMKDSVRVHKALLTARRERASAVAARRAAPSRRWSGRWNIRNSSSEWSIIGLAWMCTPTIAMLDAWTMPIKLGLRAGKAATCGGAEPVEGSRRRKLVTLTTVHYREKLHGYKWAEEGRTPQTHGEPVFDRGRPDQVREGARGGKRRGPFRVDGQGERSLQRRQGCKPDKSQGPLSAGRDRPAISAPILAQGGGKTARTGQSRRAV
jgi:homoserine O-acetyltransferase